MSKNKFPRVRNYLRLLSKTLFLLTASLFLAGSFQGSAQAQRITEVAPSVSGPDGIVKLTFDQDVKPASIKIGNVDASFVPPPSPAKTIEIKLPSNVSSGWQTISVTLPDVTDPIVSSVTVAPLITGLRARKNADLQFSRVVVEGGEVLVQFADKIPSAIRQSLNVRFINTSVASTGKVCSEGEDLDYTIPEDDYLIVTVAPEKETSSRTTYALRVCASDIPLERETRIRLRDVNYLYLRASIILLLLLLLLWIFYKIGRWVKGKLSQGQQEKRYNFLKMLLLEPENQTYSLSRAQFLGWLFVIVWCYLFLYYAHGYIEGNWGFPQFGNSIYAFLISLGTLIASQATNRGMGVKGAGEEHPSVADLVVHGGVLALDRVQQVVWTLIALGMFVRITISTFATASELPEIPNELLALMGLSSAGYLGGKMVRGPGPVIEQVTASEGSLNIKGQHLSRDAFVWLDGQQLPRESVTVAVADPDDPTKFAKELLATFDITIANWNATAHAITVVNNDAQRADWRTTAKIVAVAAGTPTGGNVTLTITGAHIAKGATIDVKDTDAVAQQDATDPNLFTVTVPEAWVQSEHDLIVTSGSQTSTFKYKPTAGGEPPPDQPPPDQQPPDQPPPGEDEEPG